jgi:predicted ATPase/class 3 adenylate cyclase
MLTLPTGTITFLFTDIEGSTQLLNRLGDRYADLLAEHQIILRTVIAKYNGHEVGTEGDAFFVAFARAADAIAAAGAAQKELFEHQWPLNNTLLVRMGLHTGEPACSGNNYTGLDVHRTARISAAAHGGQVLLSEATKILAGNRIPEGIAFRDLGEHRLKDLERPEQLFQLVIPTVRSDFPPIRSLNNCPNNLPAQITPLIGRKKALEEICELVRRSDVRFVTLTGPGGGGKTLLALQAATVLLADFADGTFVIDLSGVADTRSVPAEIARSLGVEEAGTQPLLPRIIEHLREKRLLLLLDNLEQISAASKEIAMILESCPHVKVLGTSRAPLCVRSEHVFSVPPLDVPSLQDDLSTGKLLASSAVRLFIERAKAVKGDFVINDQNLMAVVQVCSRLDGLPLAIELAAARIKLLSPQALLARLVDPEGHISLQLLTGGAHDLPARQQTMREAIAWSYDLLEANSKKLFCRLSVFEGGCTLTTAEAVCNELADCEIQVVDGIGSLIDNNLLRHTEEVTGDARIEMLQTIREFGLEQLRKSRADAEVYRAHAKYFAVFAESAEANRRGPDYTTWSEQIETERDNFRAALAWSFENEPELAVRITAAVGEFWFRQGHWTELRAASEKTLAHTAKASFEWLARCARFAGQCARVTSDPIQAKKFFEQSLSFGEKCESRVQMIEALNELGGILFHNEGSNAEARTLFDRAFKMAEELNDENYLADTIFQLGDLALAECDFEEARDKFEQAAAICRKRGYRAGTGQCMSYLAAVAIEVGEYDRAYSYLKVALEIHEKAHEAHNAIWDRYKRGQIASCRGEYTQAQIEFEECCKAFQQMSATVGEAWSLYELGKIALDKSELPEASTCFERSLGIFRTLGRANAWVTLHLGTTAIYEGRFRSAKKLLQKSLDIFRESSRKNGIALALCELAHLDRLQGEYQTAESALAETMELVRQMESKRYAIVGLQEAFQLASAQNQHECASRLLGKLEALREEIGAPLAPRYRTEYERATARNREALGEDASVILREEGRLASLDQLHG